MNPNKIKITPRDEINLKLAFASIPFRLNALYPCMCMVMNSQPKTAFYKPQIIFLLILHTPDFTHRPEIPGHQLERARHSGLKY